MDHEQNVLVEGTPIYASDMRLQLRLEPDCLRFNVPDYQHFVACGLCDHARVSWAPLDRCDVFVGKRQQFHQLERLLVIYVHCNSGGEGKSIFASRENLSFPDLHA